MLIILSVFLVLIICSGAANASSETNQTLTTEYNDEIVNVDDTDEKLTVEVSSAGSDDDSGLKELDSETREKELNKTNFIKKENNLLKASNDNQLLGNTIYVEGSTFADIQNAIDSASAGDTIYLRGTFTGSGNEISISKELSISGIDNCILDAQGKSRVFNGFVSDIKNIKFINGRSTTNGGAININGNINSIVNCSFVNCKSYSGGSAVAFYSGKCPVVNCSFENCTITTSSTAYGGAVYSYSGYLDPIVNCSFVNCKASSGGAIYGTGSSNHVINCSFIKCSSYTTSTSSGGGAIKLGSGSVVNCNFVECSSSASGSGASSAYGGALNFDSGSVVNCSFVNCKSVCGAIYGNREFSVVNSTFLDNKANSKSLNSGKNKYKLTLTFTGYENYINAIFAQKTVTFDNVTYWNGSVVNSNEVLPIKSTNEVGMNITIEVYDSKNNLVDNVTYVTNNNGQIIYDYSKLNYEEYTFKAYHPEDNYYTYIQTTGTITGTKKYNIIILNNQSIGSGKNKKTSISGKIIDNQNNNTMSISNSKLIFIRLKS